MARFSKPWIIKVSLTNVMSGAVGPLSYRPAEHRVHNVCVCLPFDLESQSKNNCL